MTRVTAPSRTARAVVLARRPEGQLRASDLRIGTVPLPEPAAGQALVRTTYFSLDPSARGRMDAGDKVYTANFEVDGPLDGWALGEVLTSRTPALPVGATVRHRLGWRELAVVDESAARVVDVTAAPAPSWLSALGQTGFTAYVGVTRIAGVRTGDVVYVSAAAGGVGSIAGQLAGLTGAGQVIGSAGGAAKCGWLRDELGYGTVIDHREGSVRDQLARTAPEGLDVYFDNVGGTQLVAALHAMRLGGRIALCGMVSTMTASGAQPPLGELIQAILRRVTLRGFIVRDHEDLRPEFESRVTAWLAEGRLIDRATVVDGLDAAPRALVDLLAGHTIGKALVRLP